MNNSEDWLHSKTGEYINSKGISSSRSHLAKACGEMIFASDIKLPGMLIGKILRSPYPHCKINEVNIEKAKTIPGVHAIVTAKDILGKNLVGKTVEDQPIIAEGIARTVLDALAIVAAESDEIAEYALKSILLDLEPLPALFDPYKALHPDAPNLHPNGNLLSEFSIIHGDAETAMLSADVIVEDTYKFPWIEHAYLETESVVAAPNNDGSITIWLGVHNIFGERSVLASAFNWSEDRFRVIHVPPGGSFGGKDDNIHAVWAALLAYYSKKPVKIVFSRKESMRGHSKRHSQIIHHKLGARSDGTLLSAIVNIFSDTGAYAHWAENIFKFASLQSIGPYRIPNAHVTSKLVYTNNIVAGAMRCWGTPGVEFAAETQINKLAQILGMHPLKLRSINALQNGDISITGKSIPPHCNFSETLLAAAEMYNINLTGE